MKFHIVTPTPALQDSLNFYQRLGFKTLKNEDSAWVSDGQVLIEINPDNKTRAGVKLYRDSWDDVVPGLEAVTSIQTNETNMVLGDPSGVCLYLETGPGPDFELSEAKSEETLGNYAGLSLETPDFDRSAEFWSALGLKQTCGALEQGWVVYSEPDGLGVSLMKFASCPHLFFNPSLTYFNGGNGLPVIERLRANGVEFAEEVTHFNKEGLVDNAILRDPGGYGFFIFND